jgi:iron complex outermembrane receptor protein
VAQNRLSFGDKLYLNGGLRIERNDGYATFQTMAMLPMLGAAYVIDAGSATLKLRSSYGKAIRPPRTSALRALSQWGMRVAGAAPDLTPESQAGIDWGADLSIGDALSLSATRFDQRASGLIETVAVGYGGRRGSGPSQHGLLYQWQNVGDVTNRGWEFEGATHAGPLALRGTLSFVDSRVASLTNGYTGELRPGDRMLNVPSRLASLTASWSSPWWSTSWTVSRAAEWIGYDQLEIADAVDGTQPAAMPRGEDFLRQFWIEYPGVTRLRATATRDLARGLTLTFTGDNLLGYQRGEPDNVTVVPGRTLLLGVRARF